MGSTRAPCAVAGIIAPPSVARRCGGDGDQGNTTGSPRALRLCASQHGRPPTKAGDRTGSAVLSGRPPDRAGGSPALTVPTRAGTSPPHPLEAPLLAQDGSILNCNTARREFRGPELRAHSESRPHYPQSVARVPVVRAVPVAVRATHDATVVTPRAAAQHAGVRPFELLILWLVISRPAPFPHVPCHVCRAALGIAGREHPNSARVANPRLVRVAALRTLSLVAPRILPTIRVPRCTLPVYLAGQRHLPPRPLRKPPAERHRLVPAYSHPRMIRYLELRAVILGSPDLLLRSPRPPCLGPIPLLRVPASVHKGLILGYRDRVLADLERLPDQVARTTVIAIQKRSCLDGEPFDLRQPSVVSPTP